MWSCRSPPQRDPWGTSRKTSFLKNQFLEKNSEELVFGKTSFVIFLGELLQNNLFEKHFSKASFLNLFSMLKMFYKFKKIISPKSSFCCWCLRDLSKGGRLVWQEDCLAAAELDRDGSEPTRAKREKKTPITRAESRQKASRGFKKSRRNFG